MRRRSGLNSTQSTNSGVSGPASNQRCARCRSPWPSTARPWARRASSGASSQRERARPRRGERLDRRAVEPARPTRARAGRPGCRAWAGRCARARARTGTAPARRAPARGGSAAMRSAAAARCAGPKAPAASSESASRPSGRRRITTACSTPGAASSPSGPTRKAAPSRTSAARPRYTSGASRRFRRSSASASALRALRVPKSRNGSVTALRSL